jgi:DNA-binding transcriptional ArsR family regulator
VDEKGTGAAVSALRASAHPVRLQMMSLLTGTAMSAAEVARELDLTHANASYHLRVLLDAGELVEAGEEKIRGGVAKRYRYPHERRGVPPERRRQRPSTDDDQVFYARAVGLELERRLRERVPGPGPHSDLEGWVPPEIWEQACDLMVEASMLLHEHNRAPRTPGTVHVSHTSWAFRMRQPEPVEVADPEHPGLGQPGDRS